MDLLLALVAALAALGWGAPEDPAGTVALPSRVPAASAGDTAADPASGMSCSWIDDSTWGQIKAQYGGG